MCLLEKYTSLFKKKGGGNRFSRFTTTIKNKKGQGFVGVILLIMAGAVVVAPLTSWLLDLQNSTNRTKETMEAQSVAYADWQEVLANNYTNVPSVSRHSVGDKYDLVREVGSEQTMSSGGLYKPVTITVYKKGTDTVAYALSADKSKPTLNEYYTKSEIDSLLGNYYTKDAMNSALTGVDSKINTGVTTAENWVSSNFYTKAQSDARYIFNYWQNATVALGWDSTNGALTAFVDGSEVSLGGKGSLKESKYNADGSWYRLYDDGWCEQGGIYYKNINGGAGFTTTINLLQKLQTPYHVIISPYTYDDMGYDSHYVGHSTNQTNSNFLLVISAPNTHQFFNAFFWTTYGWVSK